MTAPAMPGETGSRVVVELECGVTVYPARVAGGRWRAVWYENGQRRQCEAASEDRLAAKLEKVTERLAADAPNLETARRGPDRLLPVGGPAPGRAGMVGQARRYPAAAVPAVRRAGHRRDHLPGHQDRRHAEDRERRAHRGRGRPAAPGPVRHGHRRDHRRLPDQPPAARGALAARRPTRPRPAGHPARRIRAVRRPRPDPLRRRRRPARRRRWPPGGAATCTS